MSGITWLGDSGCLLWLYSVDPAPGGFGPERGYALQSVPAGGGGAFQFGREIAFDPVTQSSSYVGQFPGVLDEVAAYAGTLPAGKIG